LDEFRSPKNFASTKMPSKVQPLSPVYFVAYASGFYQKTIDAFFGSLPRKLCGLISIFLFARGEA